MILSLESVTSSVSAIQVFCEKNIINNNIEKHVIIV